MPLDEDVFTDYSVGQEIGKTNVMMLIIVVAGLKEMWRKIIFNGAETNMPFAPQCHFTILL